MLPGVARAATTATIANDLPTDWRIFTPRGHPTRDLVLLTGSQIIVPFAFPDISFSARGEETASSHVTRPRIPVKIPAVPTYVRPLSFQYRSIEKHFLLCLSHFLPIIDSRKKRGEEFLGRHDPHGDGSPQRPTLRTSVMPFGILSPISFSSDVSQAFGQ